MFVAARRAPVQAAVRSACSCSTPSEAAAMRVLLPAMSAAVLALLLAGCCAGQLAPPGGSPPAAPAGDEAPGPAPLRADDLPAVAEGEDELPAVTETPPGPPDPPEPDAGPPGPLVWGLMGLRGYAFGDTVAPNGLEFKPLFSLDLNLNAWLWREHGVYVFSDTRFWGQKAARGITNPAQGVFDFSKREFDLDLGAAWNYYGPLEARAFAYSFNNLNRGISEVRPSGYNDGVGLENRWYVGGSYRELGRPGFDVARANFLSLGFYPTKDMTDPDGNLFKPGPFARAYLTWEPLGDRWYLYADAQLIATRSFVLKQLNVDAGLAVRPFRRACRFEFRLGSENRCDVQLRELETGLYGAVRLIF